MSHKSLHTDQENPHVKFSALNLDFNSVSFDPPRFNLKGHQI